MLPRQLSASKVRRILIALVADKSGAYFRLRQLLNLQPWRIDVRFDVSFHTTYEQLAQVTGYVVYRGARHRPRSRRKARRGSGLVHWSLVAAP